MATGTYNTAAVHLRPSIDSASTLGKAQNGTTCDILGSGTGSNGRAWLNVKITSNTNNEGINLNGKTGWSWAEYIDIGTSGGGGTGGGGSSNYYGTGGTATAGHVSVTSGNLTVRTAPGTDKGSVTSLSNGTSVTYMSTATPVQYSGYYWYRITSPVNGYVAANYIATGSGGSTGGGSSLIGNPSGVTAGNFRLTPSQMSNNAQYILGYIVTNGGWTREATCAMLGNMEAESGINPGCWEGWSSTHTSANSFGLVQWDPSTNYTNWAASNGYANDSIIGQCERILYEYRNPSVQWISNKVSPSVSFATFAQATGNLNGKTLAEIFARCYERPNDATNINNHYTDRANNANYWYNELM
jgi:hypothetical protein